jgi:hypothetical protein
MGTPLRPEITSLTCNLLSPNSVHPATKHLLQNSVVFKTKIKQ